MRLEGALGKRTGHAAGAAELPSDPHALYERISHDLRTALHAYVKHAAALKSRDDLLAGRSGVSIDGARSALLRALESFHAGAPVAEDDLIVGVDSGGLFADALVRIPGRAPLRCGVRCPLEYSRITH